MNSVIIGMAVLVLSQADLILAPAGEAYFPYQGPTPEAPGVFNYGVSTVLSFDL